MQMLAEIVQEDIRHRIGSRNRKDLPGSLSDKPFLHLSEQGQGSCFRRWVPTPGMAGLASLPRKIRTRLPKTLAADLHNAERTDFEGLNFGFVPGQGFAHDFLD